MPDLRDIYYSAAVNEALAEEMERDDSVVLIGEDIGRYGGAFGVTRGLWERFGETRIWETPISENSFVGMAVGAAMMGLRPVVEIMFMDFAGLVVDQILNSAGKLHYMYNGQVTVPMVLRTPGGAKGGYGPSHSQMLSNLFVGIPGIRVVAPSDAASAKGLLQAAIRDPNPVVFIENKRLYARRGPVPEASVPPPIDRARVLAEGDDLVLLAYSAMVPACVSVAQALAEEGVSAGVVDLVSLQPLDTATIIEAVEHAGRVVIAEEACRTGGVGAEVAAVVAEECMGVLEAPIRRVACADCPIPASTELEKAVLPDAAGILEAARAVMQW